MGMGAMKAMKKVKKVSIVARGKRARAAVFTGKKAKTMSGLTKDSLMKNKTGKIVSKAASARSKKAFAHSALKKWCEAVKKARTQLGISGFCAERQDRAGQSVVYQGPVHPCQVSRASPSHLDRSSACKIGRGIFCVLVHRKVHHGTLFLHD